MGNRQGSEGLLPEGTGENESSSREPEEESEIARQLFDKGEKAPERSKESFLLDFGVAVASIIFASALFLFSGVAIALEWIVAAFFIVIVMVIAFWGIG